MKYLSHASGVLKSIIIDKKKSLTVRFNIFTLSNETSIRHFPNTFNAHNQCGD